MKAKELKDQLVRAARGLKISIPRVEPAVFLSAENLQCRFSEFQRLRVFGRDGMERSTGLPGIWAGFLNQPPAVEKNRVTPALSRQLPKLLETIGIARLHKIGKVGPYELEPKSFDAGPTWEDYLAANPSMPNDYPRRSCRPGDRGHREQRNIGLIERPECKRRWQSEPWEVKEAAALRTWLLDRCEERVLWFDPDGSPRPMTVNRLADRLRANAGVVSVARLQQSQ